jgi:hypothetical protein
MIQELFGQTLRAVGLWWPLMVPLGVAVQYASASDALFNSCRLTTMTVRRICLACGLLQERSNFFERHAVEVIHHNIKSCIDETIAFIAILFEAIAFTLRKLPSCKFELHLFTAVVVKHGTSTASFLGWFNRTPPVVCWNMSTRQF